LRKRPALDPTFEALADALKMPGRTWTAHSSQGAALARAPPLGSSFAITEGTGVAAFRRQATLSKPCRMPASSPTWRPGGRWSATLAVVGSPI